MAQFDATEPLAYSVVVVIVLFWILAIGGWIANIVKIFGSAADPITAFFIIRCVGVFLAPVGAVLGFL